MKKLISSLVIFSLILSLMTMSLVSAAPIKIHDYTKEVQTNQFRPHGGDKQEIGDTIAAFVKGLKTEAEVIKMVAQDSINNAEVLSYIKGLAQYTEIKVVSATVEKLYTVSGYDAYTNYRAIAKFKFLGTTKNKRIIERTDYIGLAKLGKNTTDWKLWGIVWQDSGIDVTDVKLIQLEMPKKGEEICIMKTEAGTIKMRLFPTKAPKSVKNFKTLAEKGYYDNMPFLRVYKDFMIQGGALDGTPDEGYCIYGKYFEDEFSKDLFNFRGALCMGNVGPNTNGNQFYIVQSPKVDQEYIDLCALPLNAEAKYQEIGGRAYLDMRYTVFGQVFEGMEVVDKIAAQKIDDNGKPLENPMKVLTVEFVKY